MLLQGPVSIAVYSGRPGPQDAVLVLGHIDQNLEDGHVGLTVDGKGYAVLGSDFWPGGAVNSETISPFNDSEMVDSSHVVALGNIDNYIK